MRRDRQEQWVFAAIQALIAFSLLLFFTSSSGTFSLSSSIANLLERRGFQLMWDNQALSLSLAWYYSFKAIGMLLFHSLLQTLIFQTWFSRRQRRGREREREREARHSVERRRIGRPHPSLGKWHGISNFRTNKVEGGDCGRGEAFCASVKTNSFRFFISLFLPCLDPFHSQPLLEMHGDPFSLSLSHSLSVSCRECACVRAPERERERETELSFLVSLRRWLERFSMILPSYYVAPTTLLPFSVGIVGEEGDWNRGKYATVYFSCGFTEMFLSVYVNLVSSIPHVRRNFIFFSCGFGTQKISWNYVIESTCCASIFGSINFFYLCWL